jgi:hypothetical protein
MRLGKEQAVGYVEDTETESLAVVGNTVPENTAQEITIDQPERMRPTPATEPVLPVG